MDNCIDCYSTRLFRNSYNEHDHEGEFINKGVGVNYTFSENFIICLDCGKIQDIEFPYEKMHDEHTMDLIDQGKISREDIENDENDIFCHNDDIIRYAKNNLKSDTLVFKIKEQDGKGFAYVSEKNKWLKNNKEFDGHEIYHKDINEDPRLTQVRFGLFYYYPITSNTKERIGTCDQLKEQLLKYNCEEYT